ncbi:MAG: trypsin-like serine protease [Actinomycetales bacterium]
MPLRRIRPLGAISAALLGLAIIGAAPAHGAIEPRVIGGAPGHPLSGASVAIETSKAYCTGALWKERIVITAAHCINGEGKGAPGEAPGNITLYSPGANRQSGAANVKVISIIYNQNWSETKDDIAFLILDSPLAAPIITRMATAEEVQSLANSRSTVTYVGYGNTASRDREAISDVALSVDEPLRPSRSGSQVFETQGDGVKGTCAGDSGGPWLAQVNGEILYLGPLSGGLGLPCDTAESPENTGEEGAVASTQTAFIDQALAAAGASADQFPSSCIEGADMDRKCFKSRTWTYDYCWSGKKATLAQQVDGAWQPVAKTTGKKYAKCGKKYPYRIVFKRTEAPGSYNYKVTVGKTGDEFTATVS